MGAPMRGLGGGKLPFDLTFFDDIFPRVSPAPDDSELSNVSCSCANLHFTYLLMEGTYK